MTWSWERKIRHINRRVSPLGLRGMRLQLLRMEVRRRRGLPEQTVPWELVEYRLAQRVGRTPTMTPQQAAWLALRHKLLAKKQAAQRAVLARRRVRISDTGIFLARRRADWLNQAEAAHEPFPDE